MIDPLVSIIVPLYNHETYIVECLDSILSQDYSRIEVLVLDDGSADNSYNLARAWIDENRERFHNATCETQDNAGICRTLGKLVDQSSGEYIYPLASDDMISEDAISKLVSAAQQQQGAMKLLFFDVELINENSVFMAPSAIDMRKTDVELICRSPLLLKYEVMLRWGLPFMHQFFNREFYHQMGGYSEDLSIEDIYASHFAVLKGYAAFHPIVGKKYRIRTSDLDLIRQSRTPGLSAAQNARSPSYLKVMRLSGLFDKMVLKILVLRERAGSKLMTFLAYKATGLLYRAVRVSARMSAPREAR